MLPDWLSWYRGAVKMCLAGSHFQPGWLRVSFAKVWWYHMDPPLQWRPHVPSKDRVGSASGLLACCLLPGVFHGQGQQGAQAGQGLGHDSAGRRTQQAAPSVGRAGLCMI